MTEQTTYHPTVNEQNQYVNDLPARFSEGDTITRVDTWADEETSHWVVDKAEEENIDSTACGFRYRLRAVDGNRSMYTTHGEIQVLAARNDIRW